MKKIDTTKWQEFELSALFTPVLSEGDNKANLLEDGTIPLVSSGSFNNGIAKYIKQGDGVSKMFEGNVITVDMFGKAFYQPQPFYAVSHGRVNILLPKFTMTPFVGLYIVSLINSSYAQRYSFTTMCNQTQLQTERISLPIKSANHVDWDYMEDFMRNIETHVNTSLEVFQTVTERKKQLLNTSQWKPFRMDALFEVVKGKRLTKSDMKEGNINYIGATAFNNGITAKIANNEYLHADGTISVCYNGSIGQAFYQEEPYWATDDVNVLYPRFAMTKNVALFIIPILRNIGQRFAYVDKWTQDKMKETEIPLPSTSNGEPDFEYMEQYMKTIEQRVQNTITKIA